MEKEITANLSLKDALKLTHACSCNACSNSCKYSSGAFIEGEIEKVAKFLGIEKTEFEKKYTEEVTRFATTRKRPKVLRNGKPYGKCIFYENGCKIHNVKPMECKLSMGCKTYGEELMNWFNIKFFFDKDNPDSLREYKLYLDAGGKGMKDMNISSKSLKNALKYEDRKAKKNYDKELGLKK